MIRLAQGGGKCSASLPPRKIVQRMRVDSCRLKAELVLARLVARLDKLRMKMPAQHGELWVRSGINRRFLHRF